MLYLDTSLLISALTNQADTNKHQDWLGAQDPRELAVSDWVVTEFSSALAIKFRTGQLGAAHRASVLAAFTRLVSDTFQLLPVGRDAFRTAARLVDLPTMTLRGSNALHLAICLAHGATLATLDRRLADSAPLVGVGVARI